MLSLRKHEKTLKKLRTGLIRLLDFQRYEHSARLWKLIEETVEEYEEQSALPDDALELYAAGDPDAMRKSDKEDISEWVAPDKKNGI